MTARRAVVARPLEGFAGLPSVKQRTDPEASPPAVTQMAEMWRYRGLIGNFATRELKSKYKHSVLGWAWSLVNPAATLLIYTIVFSHIFRGVTPPSGHGLHNFTVYLFAALVAWNFFNNVVNGGMAALIGAGPLLKKIYFPPYAPVLGNAISALTQTMIELGVLIVLLAILGNVSWTFILVPVVLALLLGFATGAALLLSLFNVHYRDVSYLVSVLLQMLFYASPIIWAPTLLAGKTFGGIAELHLADLNPMYQYVMALRNLVWDLQVPSLTRWAAMVVATAISLFIGLTVFNRYSRDVGEQL
jgi:ABC-type polysaccharide/polyol phosphate export permease